MERGSIKKECGAILLLEKSLLSLLFERHLLTHSIEFTLFVFLMFSLSKFPIIARNMNDIVGYVVLVSFFLLLHSNL